MGTITLEQLILNLVILDLLVDPKTPTRTQEQRKGIVVTVIREQQNQTPVIQGLLLDLKTLTQTQGELQINQATINQEVRMLNLETPTQSLLVVKKEIHILRQKEVLNQVIVNLQEAIIEVKVQGVLQGVEVLELDQLQVDQKEGS